MSDLVERLREVAERPDASYPAIMEQAAAEIEHLRAALREIIQDSYSLYAISVARAALEDKCTSS